jgi:RNA polymerase-binding transcription factor DksA
MRSDLKTRRKELKETLSDLSRRLAAANGSSDDAEVRCAAPDVAQMRAAEVEVASIYAALRRMDDGSYGLCASCGGKIARERLDALPFTSHCGDCMPEAS